MPVSGRRTVAGIQRFGRTSRKGRTSGSDGFVDFGAQPPDSHDGQESIDSFDETKTRRTTMATADSIASVTKTV
jgi:hypothetical protein